LRRERQRHYRDRHALDGRGEFGGIGARRCRHEHVESVELRVPLRLQRRQRGADLREPGFGLRSLAHRRHTFAQTRLHERQQIAVGLDLRESEFDASLCGAHAEIGIGGLGGDGYAHAGVVGLGRLRFSRVGLGTATQAAGEVELPRRANARVIERDITLVRGARTGQCAQWAFQ
jgi:hypothetical protein